MEKVRRSRQELRLIRGKSRAQSLMEFALTLPILLFVTMGIFDFGRALFTYAEGSNALRNALRYGAILGFQANGYPQYTDCRGMINIARHMSFATPSTVIKVSYITQSNKDGNANTVTHNDAAEYPTGQALTCTYTGGTYSVRDEDDIQAGTENGGIILISVEANVNMITPVFPRFMPISMQGIRTLVKEVQLAKCGDGIWAPTETCWNCPADMGDPPDGAEPGVCLLVEPDTTTKDHFDLEWNNVVDYVDEDRTEDKYEIEYAVSTNANWANRETDPSVWQNVGSGETLDEVVTAILNGLTCSDTIQYQFRARAIDTSYTPNVYAPWVFSEVTKLACTASAGGEGSGGAIGNGTNLNATKPSPLTTSSSNPTSIVLTFNDNSTDEDQFYIYRTTGDPTNELNWPAQASPTYQYNTDDQAGMDDVETYTDTAVTCGTTYYYRVAVHRTQGSNNYYSGYTTYKAQAPACIDPPTLLSFVSPASDIQRHLQWVGTDSIADGATGFKVQRSEDNSTWTTLETVAQPGATAYDEQDMSCTVPSNTAHTYYYRIIATNGTVDSTPSNVISHQYTGAAGCIAPNAPTALEAEFSALNESTSTGTISLRWVDNATNENRYIIEWSTSASFTSPTVIDTGAAVSGVPPVTTSWYPITFSTCGTYYFRVKARNDTTGDSAYVTDSASFLCAPSFTTTACSLSNGNNSSNNNADFPYLGWSTVTGTTQYMLEISTLGTFPTWPTVSQWLLANVNSCAGDGTDRCWRNRVSGTPVSPNDGTGYIYRVRACQTNVVSGGTICGLRSANAYIVCSP